MKRSFIYIIAAVLSILPISSAFSQNHVNPVLEGVADAGAIKYAGNYYLGGVSTNGDFFVSHDLIHWDKRVHVFDLDNQWTHGTDAKNNQVHADDISYSGGLFHLLFSVNYWGDDRHIVHITHATSPSITGPFKEVRNDQWFENRIDPQVFCDEDGRFYLYMVKFTDGNTIWGRPLNPDFTFAGDAVQQFSSQPGTWETLDNRVSEGPFVIKYRGKYYMMYNANHTAPEYGHYRLGVCEAPNPLAFNPGGKYSEPVVVPETEALDDNCIDLITYGTNNYCPPDLRHDTIDFKVSRSITGPLYMKIAQLGNCEISLNGTVLNKNSRNSYALFKVNPSLLIKGDNRIIINRKNKRHSELFALALYDTGHDYIAREGEMLLTPGQPNIVRGPNGWEWWLVYMANKGWSRDQYVDRIHFTNSKLNTEGITCTGSNGFHPAPAMPQYSGKSLDSIPQADAYLIELTFGSSSTQQGVNIGGLDIMLPKTMKSDVKHVWRIEKNFDTVTAWIDNILIADHQKTDVNNKNISWIGNKEDYDIEYISFNEGWDEYGKHFSGWDGLNADANGLVLNSTNAFKGAASDSYELSAEFDNATPDRGSYGVYAAYKDSKNYVRVVIDAAKQKLITEQCIKGKTLKSEKALSTTGIHYPDLKYTDSFEKQYRFNCDTYVSSILLPRLDADNDSYAKSLNIKERTEKLFRKDMAGRLTFSWLDGDTWKELKYNETESENPGWQKISFPAVRTRALRIINKDPVDYNRNIYRIKTVRDFSSNNQVRIDKRGGDIHIFVNDNEMNVVKLKKPTPTRIGLYSDGTANITVSNILYYKIN
jgi:GH43 family beta-xylosidase